MEINSSLDNMNSYQNKKLYLIGLAIGLLFLLPKSSFAKTYDYEKIRVAININKDGTFDVAEEMQLNLDGDFGFFYRDIDQKKLDYISDIEVFSEGRKLDKKEYEIFNKSGKKHVQWNFPRQVFSSEQKSWTLKYKVHGGLGFYRDHDEIYWNAIFSDRDVPVKLAEISVRLPEPQDMKNMTVALYSEQDTSLFIKMILNPTQYYFEGHDINPNANFTIAAGWAKGTFDYKKIFWEYWFAWHRLLAFFIPIITFVIMFILWQKKGRDPKVDKTIIPEYAPPTDLGPAEVEVLLKDSASMKGISATLIDLAVRGYLKIHEKEKKWLSLKDYKFEFLKEWRTDETLRNYEKKLLEKMLGCKRGLKNSGTSEESSRLNVIVDQISEFMGGGEELPENIVSTKELRMHKFGMKCREIFNEVYTGITAKGEFSQNPNTARTVYVIMGIIMFFGSFWLVGFLQLFNASWLAAGFGFSGLLILIFGALMPQKTLKGAEDKYKWLCFKLYLETAEKYRLEASTPEYFERYLPYAIIMGVEKKWAKRFEEMGNMQSPSWYVAGPHTSFMSSVGGFSPTGFASSMSSMVSSFASSSGGGASGGGGAGGGGGGGGGGAG